MELRDRGSHPSFKRIEFHDFFSRWDLEVLKEFYAKAAESTAFAQITPYKGMQSETGGVLGFLEVIESDFARLESESKAAEATAQKEYDDRPDCETILHFPCCFSQLAYSAWAF